MITGACRASIVCCSAAAFPKALAVAADLLQPKKLRADVFVAECPDPATWLPKLAAARTDAKVAQVVVVIPAANRIDASIEVSAPPNKNGFRAPKNEKECEERRGCDLKGLRLKITNNDKHRSLWVYGSLLRMGVQIVGGRGSIEKWEILHVKANGKPNDVEVDIPGQSAMKCGDVVKGLDIKLSHTAPVSNNAVDYRAREWNKGTEDKQGSIDLVCAECKVKPPKPQ